MVGRARELRREMTDAEQRLWFELRGGRLGLHFRRQAPIGRFIVDFVCKSAMLVVEVDGGQHNESSYDAQRDAALRELGYKILRFWNDEVLHQMDAVLDAIVHELES